MKKVYIFIAGLTPFLIGYGLNSIILKLNSNVAFTYTMIGLVFLLYWGLLGFTFSKFTSSKVYTLAICNIPALFILLLVLIQELINKRYWNNVFGIATQFFYLPIISISSKIAGFFSMNKVWELYIISFSLMIGVFYLGCYIKEKTK